MHTGLRVKIAKLKIYRYFGIVEKSELAQFSRKHNVSIKNHFDKNKQHVFVIFDFYFSLQKMFLDSRIKKLKPVNFYLSKNFFENIKTLLTSTPNFI